VLGGYQLLNLPAGAGRYQILFFFNFAASLVLVLGSKAIFGWYVCNVAGRLYPSVGQVIEFFFFFFFLGPE
jgi:hypothetical protein